MRRRIVHWFRVVFPYWGSLLGILFFVQICTSGIAVLNGRDPLARHEDAVLGVIMTFAAAATYAMYRVLAFHPLWRSDYMAWLQASPWTHRKKLPLGPVHLVLQDAVMLSLALALTWWWGKGLGADLPKFLLALGGVSLGLYLVALAITLRLCGEWAAAYAIAFGLGGCAMSIDNPKMLSALALGSYGVGYLGLRHSWRRFPWDTAKLQRRLEVLAQASKGQPVQVVVSQDSLGWPFEWLSPKPERESFVPRPDAILASLLYGWGYLAIVSVAKHGANPAVAEFGLSAFGSLGILFFAAVRMGEYLAGLSAPLTLVGRLLTGRWLIPKYDRVWLPFFLLNFNIGLLATAATQNGFIQGVLPWWDFKYFAGVWLAFMLWTQLTNAPSFRRWRLTGSVRMNLDSVWTKQKKNHWVQCN